MKLQAIVVAILLSGVCAHAQKSEVETFQDAQRLYARGRLPDSTKVKGTACVLQKHGRSRT